MARKRSTTERGYGARHQRLRRSLEPAVRAGRVHCWRCGQRILSNQDWHLGHDDHDRSKYRGPEHVACNLAGAVEQRRARRHDPDPTPRTRW